MAKATFAAGCFWGVEEAFRTLPGVIKTRVGYTGSSNSNPSYKEVCTGRSGHAEAVEVTFSDNAIPYDMLLEVFWNIHDPTQKDRQGPDIGSQYRSAIFYHDEAQKQIAIASKAAREKGGSYGGRPIVTEIVPAREFWQAEEEHQQYIRKHGGGGCKL